MDDLTREKPGRGREMTPRVATEGQGESKVYYEGYVDDKKFAVPDENLEFMKHLIDFKAKRKTSAGYINEVVPESEKQMYDRYGERLERMRRKWSSDEFPSDLPQPEKEEHSGEKQPEEQAENVAENERREEEEQHTEEEKSEEEKERAEEEKHAEEDGHAEEEKRPEEEKREEREERAEEEKRAEEEEYAEEEERAEEDERIEEERTEEEERIEEEHAEKEESIEEEEQRVEEEHAEKEESVEEEEQRLGDELANKEKLLEVGDQPLGTQTWTRTRTWTRTQTWTRTRTEEEHVEEEESLEEEEQRLGDELADKVKLLEVRDQLVEEEHVEEEESLEEEEQRLEDELADKVKLLEVGDQLVEEEHVEEEESLEEEKDEVEEEQIEEEEANEPTLEPLHFNKEHTLKFLLSGHFRKNMNPLFIVQQYEGRSPFNEKTDTYTSKLTENNLDIYISGKYYKENILEEVNNKLKSLKTTPDEIKIDENSAIFEDSLVHVVQGGEYNIMFSGKFLYNASRREYTPFLSITIKNIKDMFDNDTTGAATSTYMTQTPDVVYDSKQIPKKDSPVRSPNENFSSRYETKPEAYEEHYGRGDYPAHSTRPQGNVIHPSEARTIVFDINSSNNKHGPTSLNKNRHNTVVNRVHIDQEQHELRSNRTKSNKNITSPVKNTNENLEVEQSNKTTKMIIPPREKHVSILGRVRNTLNSILFDNASK